MSEGELYFTMILKQEIEKQDFQIFGFTDPLLVLEDFQINRRQYGLVAGKRQEKNPNNR